MDQLKPGYHFLSYRLEKCIGKGAFGAVWSAIQDGSGQNVAIKFEFLTVTKSILPEESEISKDVSSCSSFPQYFGNGKANGFEYLILERLGMSLRVFQENHPGGVLPMNEVGRLGKCMLSAIRDFHNAGYVHRDIKPSNFVFRGQPIDMQVCLIDFGLAKRWRSPEGEIFSPREKVGFRGTSRYASIYSHEGMDLGRRDDLWSLFYVLIELCAPPLPWKTQTNKDSVMQLKKRGVQRLCVGLPPQLLDFGNHLSTLQFSDEPNYTLLEGLLNTIVENSIVEASEDYGVCLSEQYTSMGLIVAPNGGSVIGSSSAVEGSWEEQPIIAVKQKEISEEVSQQGGNAGNQNEKKGGCCNVC